MGSNILVIFVKAVTKGSGLKISIITSINLFIILFFRNNTLIPYITLLITMVASAAMVIIDFRLYSILLYVLFAYGSRPNNVRLLILLHSLLVASVLSLPYLIVDVVSFSLALTLAFLIVLGVLSLVYKSIRNTASIPQI
ncbi:MAG: hypothetical protein QN229_03620 [Desulfurococcaceae archaeon TW002]